MADRVVRVRLSADVDSYTRSVNRAADSTDRLRHRAERFEGVYIARLVVNGRQADRSLARTRRSIQDTILHMDRMRGAIRGLALSYGTLASLPQIGSLGSSLVDMVGVLNLLPAAGFAAAGGVAAIALGLRGMKDALEGIGSDPEEFAATLEGLAPSARETAIALNEVAGAWGNVSNEVQQALFSDMAVSLDDLSSQYLPVVADGISGIAKELGDAADAFMRFAARATTVEDAAVGLELIEQATIPLARSITNLSQVFRDMGSVGAEFLPELAVRFQDATGRLRDFIAEARDSGDLSDWIQDGIDATTQFAGVIRQTGSVMNSVFEAADASGVGFLDTLDRVSASADAFLDSAEGQQRAKDFFSGIREVVDELRPGVRDLGGMVRDFVGQLSDTGAITSAASAFSSLAEGARPVASTFGQLVGVTLGPLLNLLDGIAPAIGPAIGAFVAFRIASAALGGISGRISKIGSKAGSAGEKLGLLAIGMGLSGQAGQRFADGGTRAQKVLGGMARSLPLVAAGLVAVSLGYDAIRSKAGDYARDIIAGSMGVTEAIEKEAGQIRRKNILMLFADPAMAGYTLRQDSMAKATENVNREIKEHIATLPPMEQAQARVTVAQDNLNNQVRLFGPASDQAADAAIILTSRQQFLEVQQRATAEGTDLNTAAMLNQADAAFEATNADIRYERGLLTLESAQDRAKEAAKEHGEGSFELRDAQLAVREAAVRVAAAARDKAAADAEATGSGNAAEAGARAQKEEYLLLSRMVEDPLSRELRELAATIIPDKNFAVRGTGQVVWNTAVRGRMPNEFADGGILPGYTPGKDVHDFVSPTGGSLRLSGGEAIMRPEWTRAIGAENVEAMNRAARTGGVSGVARVLAASGSRTPGGEANEFARGGVFMNGVRPYPRVATEAADHATRYISSRLAPRIASRVRRIEEMLRAPSGGSQGMMRALRMRFPGLPLNSGYRPGAITATGNPSYHGMNRAVDVPPRMDVFNYIRSMYGSRTKELIFSPAGRRQIHNGSPHYYTGITRAMHFDHVHWAYDQGGIADGPGMMRKVTSRPERVLSPDQTESFERLVSVLDGTSTPRIVRVPAGVGGDGSGSGRGDTIINAPIYNPVAERGSDSVQKRLTRLAKVGMFSE